MDGCLSNMALSAHSGILSWVYLLNGNMHINRYSKLYHIPKYKYKVQVVSDEAVSPSSESPILIVTSASQLLSFPITVKVYIPISSQSTLQNSFFIWLYILLYLNLL